MNDKQRWIFPTLGGLGVFVGIVGGGLAVGYVSAPSNERGEPSGHWMIVAFLVATTLATMVVFAMGRARARRIRQDTARLHQAIFLQGRAERAHRVETLQAALHALPELAHYAAIVDQRPVLTSIEDARRREALVRRLRADARTAPHAERAFRGEEIGEALIAHWQEPERPLTCAHFRSLEAPLRAQPGGLVPITAQHLRVHANLDVAVAALRQSSDATGIDYQVEELQPGRGSDVYQGGQTLRCTRCGCTIDGSALGPGLRI